MRSIAYTLLVGLLLSDVWTGCSFRSSVPACRLGRTVLRMAVQDPPAMKRKGATKRDTMLEQILESVDFTRSKAPPQVPIAQDPLLPMVQAIALAADKRKAGSINAFRISHITEITTFMVVIEGNSRPQNQAIALAIEDDVLVAFTEQPSKEGDAASGWILLDYGSVIVHIMTPQMRNFYKLEKRWKDAEVSDIVLSGVILPPYAHFLRKRTQLLSLSPIIYALGF